MKLSVTGLSFHLFLASEIGKIVLPGIRRDRVASRNVIGSRSRPRPQQKLLDNFPSASSVISSQTHFFFLLELVLEVMDGNWSVAWSPHKKKGGLRCCPRRWENE